MLGSNTYQQDSHNDKLNTSNYGETRSASRWNNENQVNYNNETDIGGNAQAKFTNKRDEWRYPTKIESTNNTAKRQNFTNTPNYGITRKSSTQHPSHFPENSKLPTPPQPNSLATSEGFIHGTDRTSISKLLAQRRASAPSVSVAQQQQLHHTQQQIISQYNSLQASSAASNPRQVPQVSVARSKGASKEVYGFVCWITSFVAYAFYLLWGCLPERFLRSLGVYYFPNRYWVIAVPAYFMVAILFGILTYVCINLINTDPLHSFHSFSDAATVSDHDHQEHENSIPAATDIPLTLVNELLYQNKKHATELSPTFSKFSTSSSQRSRVFASNKIRNSTENKRAESYLSAYYSPSTSTTLPQINEHSDTEGPSSPLKRVPTTTSSLSTPDTPIRRTSSYSLFREESM